MSKIRVFFMAIMFMMILLLIISWDEIQMMIQAEITRQVEMYIEQLFR